MQCEKPQCPKPMVHSFLFVAEFDVSRQNRSKLENPSTAKIATKFLTRLSGYFIGDVEHE